MKVILSELCYSLSGSLGRGYGYYLQQTANGCTSHRNTKGFVPPDGHWRFIVLCAEMATGGFPIADIRVSGADLYEALEEAGYYEAAGAVLLTAEYDAKQVLTFKNDLAL